MVMSHINFVRIFMALMMTHSESVRLMPAEHKIITLAMLNCIDSEDLINIIYLKSNKKIIFMLWSPTNSSLIVN